MISMISLWASVNPPWSRFWMTTSIWRGSRYGGRSGGANEDHPASLLNVVKTNRRFQKGTALYDICLLCTPDGSNAREAAIGEDCVLEIVSVDEIPFFCGIIDVKPDREGASVYTPDLGNFPGLHLSFSPAKGGFVVTDSHGAVLARYVLRQSGLVCLLGSYPGGTARH